MLNNGRIGLSIKEITEETDNQIILSERENLYLLCEKQRVKDEEGEDVKVPLKSNFSIEGIVSALSPLTQLQGIISCYNCQ